MTDDFTVKVRQQIEKLSTRGLPEIEAATAAKRVTWCQEHPLDPGSEPTPRLAYERLFFDYMGLSPEDVPVVEETADRIVWRSLNPCPTLDACLALGLDTRQVCRAAYETSTQAFLSQLDPCLRFGRSYEQIRPYAAHCLEWITRVEGSEKGTEV